MKDVNTTDSPTLHKGAGRASDGFHFREFRHGRGTGSSSRLESERMLSSLCLSGIGERGENGFAFVPVGKLVGVMAAPRLAGLPRGDEHNGFIPVFGVADKAHRRAVSLHGRAHAVLRSRLRLVRDAEESFQQTVVPN